MCLGGKSHERQKDVNMMHAPHSSSSGRGLNTPCLEPPSPLVLPPPPMSDSSPPTTEPPPTTKSDGDAHDASVTALLTSQFGALLDAVKTLNVTMDGVKTTLVDHGKKFDILTRDALKNDQPYDQKDLDDESTCMALYDMVMAKTKEKADEWKETMEVTLIFIALFSAVLTAFLVPATQALLPNSTTCGNSTSSSSQPPPLPPRSAEAVCAFYYLSLIIAIIIAVLCALGRRWVRKLTIKPNVKTWREKMFWHIERMRRAESWLQALMEVLYWMLLSSIGLFMSGLLYQLWNVSHSFEETASILLATWALGVILVCGIMSTMISTTYHAVRYQGSVFEGLVSRVIVGEVKFEVGLAGRVQSIWTWSRLGAARAKNWFEQLKIKDLLRGVRPWIKTVKLANLLKRTSRWIRALVGSKSWKSLGRRARNIWWKKLIEKLNFSKKAREWIKKTRVEVECESTEKLFATYLDLIGETSDPTLLDRAVASLSYRDWMQYGRGSVDQLQKVYTRLMATDTSFRVKETVTAQISRFSAWIPKRRKQIEENREDRALQDGWAREGDEYWIAQSKEREEEAKKEEEEEARAIQLTRFLLSQRKDNISRGFTPTWENCTHIFDLLSLPFDKFVAKCLCIHDHNINLGDHQYIFFWSVNHCDDLLRADKSDDVMRILSHVDLFSAVRSFVLADSYESWYDRVFKLIIGDRRTEVLGFLNEFLSTPRDWSSVDSGGASAVFLIAAGSPPKFPSDLDLSPIIVHIGRHPSLKNWTKASDASIAYLMRCDISALSERRGVHEFLQHCVDRDFRDEDGYYCDTSEETRHAAQTLLDQHQILFSPLPLPTAPGASIDNAEDMPQSSGQNPCPNIPDSDQIHLPHDVASTSEPDDPPETHIPLPSEDHELIDMSMPSEPGI
ncbi:hypothetical protein SISNIDRAFT_532525 [Sistotremastrum niveocremeum HHB9708]|uniref:DUF6535 domain-containing protein n=1 Tax=Sistotremastrum niveocremeum HHB9708 TaxID=1314777 RepID=A0A164P0E9_9AGAM|nr:hypothetical protein SISNIDRAFT_532525 [Sistotremastrum niveocremeum HHB9708]